MIPSDCVRMALAPLHVVAGLALCFRYATVAHTPTVLLLGLALVGFGAYKIGLIVRALRGERRGGRR